MELDYTQITSADRACINCKFMKRLWTITGIADLVVSKFGGSPGAAHYRCTNYEPEVKINQITGVTKTQIVSEPCLWARAGPGPCSEKGYRWQPSQAWLNNPDNLFKVLSTDIQKESK